MLHHVWLFLVHLLPPYQVPRFTSVAVHSPHKLFQQLLPVRLCLASQRNPHHIGAHLLVQSTCMHEQLYEEHRHAVRILLDRQAHPAFPMLSSGCKMVALLGRPRKPMLKDNSTTATIFGHRKGRVSLVIQEDPYSMPVFFIELPMHTSALNKEMGSDMVRIALESETKTHRKKLLEEFVWGVYCNGRKVGYSIRRKQMNEEEANVMQHLRGVSMGAGVIPSSEQSGDGEITYMRARFERVVGSKDSEAFYMINPDDAQGPELSIFFVRVH